MALDLRAYFNCSSSPMKGGATTLKIFVRIIQRFVVVIGLFVLATSGQAALFTETQGFGTVSATNGPGAITVTLKDIAVAPTSVIRNISGFVFSTPGVSGVVAVVPEASALVLFSTGLVGLVVWRRRKRFK